MIRLGDLIRPITSRLRANKAEFAVIGGLAVSARTVPRFTKDADFAVMVENDAEAERLVFEVTRDGFQVVTLIDQTATNRLATARLSLAGGGPEEPVIDLIFATCGIEPEVVRAAEPIQLFVGVTVPVAQIGHLIALKVLSQSDRRPQDTLDVQALMIEAAPDDLDMASAALDLIAERGYHRGKDLQAEYRSLLARFLPGH
jgi:predicted nucleotidyltransferase